jgi:hypothetical protein
MREESIPNLDEIYKRRIGTALAVLDETVCEFEQWAKGREIHSVLYSESNSLTPEQPEGVLSEVGKIRDVLAKVKAAFGLEENIRNASNTIWSQCSGLWATLAEMASKRLKGYGEPPPDFAEYWEPKISELEEHINHILEVLKRN